MPSEHSSGVKFEIGHVLFIDTVGYSKFYLGLGDLERAMDLLEQASADDSQWMMYLKIDRIFNPLRANPRFIALMKDCHFDR